MSRNIRVRVGVHGGSIDVGCRWDEHVSMSMKVGARVGRLSACV